MKCEELRQRFLNYFQSKGHKIFPSDSLVPQDKSLLFTSAGMNQFKPYFLGEKKDVKRAASCQRCLRTDDLEKVGKTPYHHTFFEMLGNFSFGDYFKKEAIEFAWKFLINELNIKKERLWVSIYKDDEEAFHYWKKITGIEDRKIAKLGEDKNFWPSNAPASGPDGPCGPCSEIFFDKGMNVGCGRKNCGPGCDCGRFVEIWNLVFTQFNRQGKNNLLPLPQKNIDTGMGLERMASILQEKESNFEIDIFQPIIKFLQEFLKSKKPSLINAIADYSRAAIFAIGDGVFPSNEERGYVVRKLIRKALYLSYPFIDKKPYIYRLVVIYADVMREVYPEVFSKEREIAEVIFSEEERFLATIERGKYQLETIMEEVKNKNRKFLSAEEVFRLYDTYGFPLELTEKLAAREGISVDTKGVHKLLEQQRQRARKKSMFVDKIFTESKPIEGKTEFVGYERCECQTQVVKIIKGQEELNILRENERANIILDKTCFYPESGGQLSDQGEIVKEEAVFIVEEVKKIGEVIVHCGYMKEGEIRCNDNVKAVIDKKRRIALARAHTATHLLQAALRQIIGGHIMQQGSLVDVDRLRFDFAHFKKLSDQELEKVEELVNAFILQADKVKIETMLFKEAIKKGALAFFKEKYKERVRVVSIGDYSIELCGGTHVNNTSEVGIFCIDTESSISSGIRRIQAVVGKLAYSKLKNYHKIIKDISFLLKTSEEGVKISVESLHTTCKEQKLKNERLEKELLRMKIDAILEKKREIEGITYIISYLKEKPLSLMLYAADILRQQCKSLFVFLFSKLKEKNVFVCAITSDLLPRGISASTFINCYRNKLSLKGGGKEIVNQGIIQEDIVDTDRFERKVENFWKEFVEQRCRL